MNAGPGSSDPLAVARERAAAHGLPLMGEGDWPEAIALPEGLSLRFLRTAMVLPLGPDAEGDELVALADPSDGAALEALRAVVGRRLAPRVASVPAILARIDGLAAGAARQAAPLPEDEPEADDDDRALDAPVIALLDRLLAQAVADRATDLHFEPLVAGMVVRQRVDGLLRPLSTLPAATGRALVARLKILAGLNIAERRLPQDGHIRAVIGGAVHDLRCATLPMVDGEGAALRILPDSKACRGFRGWGSKPGPRRGCARDSARATV